MKLRLLIIPALMATALFAQGPGPGGFGGRRESANGMNTPRTPPTPEQLATREVNMISALLKLGTAQTSQLLAALAGPSGPLTVEQTTLQGYAVTLKTDYAKLVADIGTSNVSGDETAISGVELSILEARASAAGAVLTELKTLGVATSTQQTNLINMLVHGGGGFHGGRF